MSSRNSHKNKALRRQEREENRRRQEKKKIANKVKTSLSYGSLFAGPISTRAKFVTDKWGNRVPNPER